MMKNGIAALLLALFWNAVSVSANCQTITLTFNFKPKFPYGNSADFVCGDLEDQAIETVMKAKLNELFEKYGLTDVALGNLQTDRCPSYQCNENPGHKCLPYCFDVQICGVTTDLSSWTSLSITDDQLVKIKTDAIDEVRSLIPECLGIQNQFMMDVHASLAGQA